MSPRSPEQFAEIREERKQQILNAALHVFAQGSYHGASIAAVAKKANVSKGLIYNYFESKEALLKTLVADLFEEMMELMALDADKPLDREGFIRIIELSINEVVQNPQRWKLYMSLSFQPDVTPILLEEILPRMQPFMVLMSDYFVRNGHEDPLAMMRYYSAVLDGVQMHILMDPENFPVEQVKKMMIQQFS